MRVVQWIVVAAAAVFAGAAQASDFSGWQRQANAEQMMLVSPADSSQQTVALIIGKRDAVSGDATAYFRGLIDSAGADADIAGRSGVKKQNGMMLELLRLVRPQDGFEIDALVMAYQVPGGYQPFAVVYPSSVTDRDARVVQALDFVSTAFNERYEMSDPAQFARTAPKAKQLTTIDTSKAPPPASAAPAPVQAAPAPSSSGKKCERRPVWGLRVSAWCQPSGICNDLVIKDYETVCE